MLITVAIVTCLLFEIRSTKIKERKIKLISDNYKDNIKDRDIHTQSIEKGVDVISSTHDKSPIDHPRDIETISDNYKFKPNFAESPEKYSDAEQLTDNEYGMTNGGFENRKEKPKGKTIFMHNKL